MRNRMGTIVGLVLLSAGGLATLAAVYGLGFDLRPLTAVWLRLGTGLTLSFKTVAQQVDVQNIGDALALAIGLLLGTAMARYTASDTPIPTDPAAHGKTR